MNKRTAAFCFSLLILTAAFYFGSCKRIHDATTLGGDLIPAVDNVNTFDTVLTVESYNDSFTIGNANKLVNDSTRLGGGAIHYVGRIDNDPLFGKTNAELYMELKPASFKYYFEYPYDSLFLDSVVLVLDYKETYGDSNAVQTVNVYELGDQTSNLFKGDSNYLVRVKSFTPGALLGSKTFAPNILNDSIKAYKDTTANQLRIRLDDAFGNRLLKYDSTNAYVSDSAFKSKFKGFAILSEGGGNALMGFGMPNSKLALYYRYKKQPNQDTTVRYFTFNTAIYYSGSANYVTRNYNGYPIATALSGGTSIPDDLIYLQATPGTFARIKIPGLQNLTNRVVHRAELIVEEVYDPSDLVFTPPGQLFLDILDTALKDYRYVPLDFTITTTGAANVAQFGTTGKLTTDAAGNPIEVWKFNLSRYIQNVLTQKEPAHDMRLFVPAIANDIYKPSSSSTALYYPITINSKIANGRVRVAGGSYGDPNVRMRLRIIYSKI